jgi:hypothetical protein
MKKIVKIKFVDFFDGFDNKNNQFIDVLSKKYDIKFSEKPDYIIYSIFGLEHLEYDCIRIFYTGECLTPNFNECDYAIGFDRLIFGDRYLRAPLYQLFQYKKSFDELKNKKSFSASDLKSKTRFCNFIYSNCWAQDERTKMFDKLNKYKRVDSGGRYLNNIGGAVKDKLSFQKKCKFSIAFENTSYDGYSTEKITDAFVSGTVPIYYGDPRIAEDFNEDSFINMHSLGSVEAAVERVKEIDVNDELYIKMMNTPVVKIEDVDIVEFLYSIFDQDKCDAMRRPFSIHAKQNEKRQLRHKLFEKYIYKYFLKLGNQYSRIKSGSILTTKRR